MNTIIISNSESKELILDKVFSTLDCRLGDNIEQTFNVIERSLENGEMDIATILEKNFYKLYENANNSSAFAKQFIANSFIYNNGDDENQTVSKNNE